MNTYSSLIYLITWFLLLIIWILIILKNHKSKSVINLFLFILSVIFWMLSLYLWYYLIDPLKPNISTFFIRLTFWFWILWSFFLCAFAYYYPYENFKIQKTIKYWFLLLTVFTAVISSFTSLVYEKEIIVNWNEIQDKHWSFHNFFLIHYLFNLWIVIWISFSKILKSKWIERNKIIISLIGILSVSLSVALFHTILPKLNIYLLQTEVILFNLFFVILTFYSMQKYRFFNISIKALNIIRTLIFWSVFFVIIIWSKEILEIISINKALNLIISSSIWLLIMLILEKFFPKITSSGYREMKNKVWELKSKLYYCESYRQLQKEIEESFVVKLWISNAKTFIIRDSKSTINIPYCIKNELTEILSKMYDDVLVYEEIDYKFKNTDKNRREKIKKLMESIWSEICIPLFAEKRLIWFLSIWKKSGDSFYTEEEINELIEFKKSLEISFMNVLIKWNLKEENDYMKEMIRDKTNSLQKQNEKIKKLFKQQSDFISVTAHEFRTPLSIAMFQLESALDKFESNPKVSKEIWIIEESLKNLQELTKRLFSTQQYDLEKITLNKEKINLNKFIKWIYNDFKPEMSEKNIDFKLEDKTKEKIEIEVDLSQIRQVLNNILSNAKKFTEKWWIAEISLDKKDGRLIIKISDNWIWIKEKDKKTIFDKFKTNHPESWMWIWLWLYICKKIIELHNWKIKVEDSKIWWTSFCLEFRV